MDISKVKTAVKIGDFILRNEDSPNHISIRYISSNEDLNHNLPRVYIITSNGEIKKIGGSSATGGIKATMNFYINARTGSPGPSRFIIHELIKRELEQNKQVELFVITSSSIKARVPGLFSYHIIDISSSKEMEKVCKDDFYKIENRYPDWNFQENKETYHSRYKDIYNEYLQYHKNRISK